MSETTSTTTVDEYDALTMGDITYSMSILAMNHIPFLDVVKDGVKHNLKFVIQGVTFKITGTYKARDKTVYEESSSQQVNLVESMDDVDPANFVPRAKIEPATGQAIVKKWVEKAIETVTVADNEGKRRQVKLEESMKKQIFVTIAEKLYKDAHPELDAKDESTGEYNTMPVKTALWLT